MRAAKLFMAVLIAMPSGALAQDQSRQTGSIQGQSKLEEGQSSKSCISNIVFSQAFLTRYPRAGSAIPTAAVAGSTIANKPNKMNSTPAKLYQPVKLFAVSITGRSVAI